MPLQIRFADVPDVELAGDEARALADELGALGCDELAIAAAEGTRSRAVLRVDETSLPSLARALDHLWNANPDDFDSPDSVGPATRALSAAREGCLDRLDAEPIFYLVRTQGDDYVFWSYSGPYAEGDRLVYHSGEVFTVLAVAPDELHFNGVLVVDRVLVDATADPDQD